MEKVRLSFKEQMQLVVPYAYHNIKEQFIIVVPVCMYIVLFQLIVLKFGIAQVGAVAGGIVCVFLGLAFFLEGIRVGPVPIGEIVGNTLPKKQSSAVVLVFALFLGILASFGEPVLGTLQMAGAHIKQNEAPLLYMLLVGQPMYLVLTVGVGVGVAVLIGTLRFLHGWSLKFIILPLVSVAIILTVVASTNPIMSTAIGLAWDTGAVIVGPVLCPLVLALGVGVSRAAGKTSPTMAGFGMVGIISVVPIVAVILLTFTLYFTEGDKLQRGPSAIETEKVEGDNQSAAAEVPDVVLPADLSFSVYYPKLRLLSLPSELDKSAYNDKIAALSPEDRAIFDGAYELDETLGAIELRPRLEPKVRAAIYDVLARVGYDTSQTTYSYFLRAYTVTIEDELALKGSIALKPDVPPDVRAKALEILKSIGYADQLPLFVDSLVLGARAILPIFAFLFVIMLLLKQKGPNLAQVFISLGFAIIGLCLFFFGLSIGLGALGNQIGDRLPVAFLDYLPLFPTENALFSTDVGKVIVIIFALILGYGATLAEPAFNVLGQQVEDVTQGAFKKSLFSQAVAIGVGIGAGLGIMSLLYNINLLYLLLPPYVLLALLTVFNREIFVNIAWDGGAVTTGPVTVPLKLAIGLSLSSATGAGEGFGVLALASAYPVLNILLLGVLLTAKKNKEERAAG